MHELTICQAILRQVLDISNTNGCRRVGRIALRIGPLAGVEPDLLMRAFPIVAAGTVCDSATVAIERSDVRVKCKVCRATCLAQPNRLLCAVCGDWRVDVIGGDEMLLASVELLAMTDQKECVHV